MLVETPRNLWVGLFVVRLIYPLLLLAISLSILFLKPPSPSASTLDITPVIVAIKSPRRSLITSLLSLVALLYFLDGFALVLHSVLTKTWQGIPSHGSWITQWSGLEIEAVDGLLASAFLAMLALWKETHGVNVWLKKRVRVWALIATASTVVEVILTCMSVDFFRKRPVSIPEIPPMTQPSFPALLHTIFPILRLLILIPLYPILISPRVSYIPAAEAQETSPNAYATETTSLLVPTAERAVPSQGLSATSALNDYGTIKGAAAPTTGTNTRAHTPALSEPAVPSQTLKSAKVVAKDEKTGSARNDAQTWGELWRRIKKLSPYLWPSKSPKLQFLALLCILILIVGRFVSIALPLTLGSLVSIMEDQYENPPTPEPESFWPYLLGYVALRFLQASGGLNALRDALWAPVMQYSDREMSQMTFSHLLNLSLAFHTRRKTGEVLRILDRGQAINQVFQLLLFNICPTFIDIAVALCFFVFKFGWELATVVFFVMFAYVTASITMTTWRTKLRREMNDRDVVTRGIHTDCLLNYETVKYFGGEAHEFGRYTDAVKQYQALEYRVIISLNLLNLVQNFTITFGLLVGSIIVALRVTRHVSRPSDFVIFITYLAQLYGPLNQLGFIYRNINTSLVDTERLMKLLAEPTEVNDKPGAPDLIVNDGEIEFENVSFSYDGRVTALNGVSFKVPKGSSVALVGESGSGKSTILRLLYRFYDLNEGEGRILIDGHDIRDVTQLSLRKAIGVVPQDSVLFNTSIGYNIGYGKFGSSPEEIEAAAKAAQMHDRIMSFPDQYKTVVGERGVRLSGGEKQRVAIARTLLKNPPILLLDEATSALDTSTEKDIQKALQNLVQGRSSLSIAHRLSTIASADLILVLKDGQIVEQGTFRDLLAKEGIFATMWADQVSAEEPLFSTGEGSIMKKEKEPEVPGYDVGTAYPTGTSAAEELVDVSVHGAPSIFGEAATVAATTDAVPGQEADEQVQVPFTEEPEEQGTEDPSRPVSYAQVAAAPPQDENVVIGELPQAVAFPSVESQTPVAFPTSSSNDEVTQEPVGSSNDKQAPLAFPSTGDDASVAFPTSDDQTTASAPPQAAPTGTPKSPLNPAVTFNVENAPARSGTPDPTGSKRKRISSQNFQRIARRISFGPKRSGSSTSIIVPQALLGRESPKEGSVQGEGSGRASVDDSASGSIQGEDNKKLKKKDKKDKKKGTK